MSGKPYFSNQCRKCLIFFLGASISSQKIASLEPNNASQESSGESDSEDEETRQLRKSKKVVA